MLGVWCLGYIERDSTLWCFWCLCNLREYDSCVFDNVLIMADQSGRVVLDEGKVWITTGFSDLRFLVASGY